MTPRELHHLTGRTQPAAQMRWLNAHGWNYTTGFDGLPKVARAHFDLKMVAAECVTKTVPVPQDWQVNVAALRNLSVQ